MEILCQRHNNCGGYCEAEAQIENNLCEDCMDAEKEQDAAFAALCLIADIRCAANDKSSKLTTDQLIELIKRITLKLPIATRKWQSLVSDGAKLTGYQFVMPDGHCGHIDNFGKVTWGNGHA